MYLFYHRSNCANEICIPYLHEKLSSNLDTLCHVYESLIHIVLNVFQSRAIVWSYCVEGYLRCSSSVIDTPIK